MKKQLSISLKDFRAVKEADLILDGITVLAGENGSGKSTISKLTYNMFLTAIEYDNIVDAIFFRKYRDIYKTLRALIHQLSPYLGDDRKKLFDKLISPYTSSISELLPLKEDNSLFLVIDSLKDIFKKVESLVEEQPEATADLFRAEAILKDALPEENHKDQLSHEETLDRIKNRISGYSHKNLEMKNQRPLHVWKDRLEEVFPDFASIVKWEGRELGVPIMDYKNQRLLNPYTVKEVVYIDTPMIVGVDLIGEGGHWERLDDLLRQKRGRKTDSEIDHVFLNDVLKGEVSFDSLQEFGIENFVYKREDGEEFNLLDCATGLKSFSILQMLYKNGILHEKTLLIIDEPEVHLHPQWVVEYARLIVLLRKKLGVRFLIASHHPDMISAIKYISEKEEIQEDLNYYLANKEENSYAYTYKHLGWDIESIFTSFNIAFRRMDLYGTTD